MAEWLRESALTQARIDGEEKTDTVLLAELLALRSMIVNLFAVASKGPLSDEILRKISAYADSIKCISEHGCVWLQLDCGRQTCLMCASGRDWGLKDTSMNQHKRLSTDQ